MASISAVITLSVFLISLQYSALDVNAFTQEQHDKISQFCSNLPDTSMCSQCIKDDDRAATADNEDLAVLAVNCAAYPMRFMLDYLHTFQDQPLKSAAEDCSLPLEKAADVFAYIIGKIEGHNYGDAQFAASHKIQTWLSHCKVVLSRNGFFHAIDLLISASSHSDNLVQILGKLASEGKH